jgi:hypothetical protein
MISERYHIDSVGRSVEGMSSFAEYDKVTHWHGNYISKYKGKAFYYREFFHTGQIKYLLNIFKNFIVSFGYM